MIQRLKDLYRQLTLDDNDDHPLLVPVLALIRWVVVFYKQLSRDKAFIRAGAMSYYTLVALVPVLLLLFGLVGAIGSFGLDVANQQNVENMFLNAIVADIPAVRKYLVQGVRDLPLRAIGLVGLVSLLAVSAQLFLMVEQAYNDVFEVPITRSLLTRVLNVYVVMTAAPLVASVAFVAVHRLFQHSALADYLLELGLTWLALIAAIKGLPCTTVQLRPAAWGAFFSALLLGVARYAFGWYVALFRWNDPAQQMYGAIGLLPVVLVWLYAVWLIILLGVEVAFVSQYYGSLWRAEVHQRERDDLIVHAPHVGHALALLAQVGVAFETGCGPVPGEALATSSGLDPRTVDGIARVLEKAGFICRTKKGWLLKQASSLIALSEVTAAWYRLTSPSRSTGVGQPDAELPGKPTTMLALNTLADVIREQR